MQTQQSDLTTEIDRSRVLVADDSDELRTLIRSVLEKDGFEVVEARDGSELIEALGFGTRLAPSRSFDLVISDVRMPHMSGLEVLQSLRALQSPLPVILMTAFGDVALHQKAHALGAAMTLDKPLSLYSLRDAVRKLLDPPWW